jgi:hypothetical protein
VIDGNGNGPAVNISNSKSFDENPCWGPTGRRLAFVRENAIWRMRADGTHQNQATHPRMTTSIRASPRPATWRSCASLRRDTRRSSAAVSRAGRPQVVGTRVDVSEYDTFQYLLNRRRSSRPARNRRGSRLPQADSRSTSLPASAMHDVIQRAPLPAGRNPPASPRGRPRPHGTPSMPSPCLPTANDAAPSTWGVQ